MADDLRFLIPDEVLKKARQYVNAGGHFFGGDITDLMDDVPEATRRQLDEMFGADAFKAREGLRPEGRQAKMAVTENYQRKLGEMLEKQLDVENPRSYNIDPAGSGKRQMLITDMFPTNKEGATTKLNKSIERLRESNKRENMDTAKQLRGGGLGPQQGAKTNLVTPDTQDLTKQKFLAKGLRGIKSGIGKGAKMLAPFAGPLAPIVGGIGLAMDANDAYAYGSELMKGPQEPKNSEEAALQAYLADRLRNIDPRE